MTYPAGTDGLELDFVCPAAYGAKGTDLLGFWVAIGNEGGRGAAPLTVSFPLHGHSGALGAFLEVPAYRKSFERAKKAWLTFAAWSRRKHGLELGTPSLWLVRTEIG